VTNIDPTLGRNIGPISCVTWEVIRGVPKFRNLVTWPRPRPLWGRFVVRTQ